MSDPLERLNVRIPSDLLTAIDADAALHGEDRSAAVRRLLPVALGMPGPSVAVRVEDIDPARLVGMLTEGQRRALGLKP